jgi:hypothetical protein
MIWDKNEVGPLQVTQVMLPTSYLIPLLSLGLKLNIAVLDSWVSMQNATEVNVQEHITGRNTRYLQKVQLNVFWEWDSSIHIWKNILELKCTSMHSNAWAQLHLKGMPSIATLQHAKKKPQILNFKCLQNENASTTFFLACYRTTYTILWCSQLDITFEIMLHHPHIQHIRSRKHLKINFTLEIETVDWLHNTIALQQSINPQ